MREEVLTVEHSGEPLIGVVTLPESRPERGTVLFLTAGILPRVGPNRIYVRLARALAEHGWRAFRFDLSNVGDSPPNREELSFEERSSSEIRAVVDALSSRYGSEAFVLTGICSGADLALLSALDEPRVVACALINGLLEEPATAIELHDHLGDRARWRYYVSRLTSFRSWARFLTLRSDYGAWKKTLASLLRRAPARSEDSRITELLERRVPALLVYCEGSPGFDHFLRSLHGTVKQHEHGDGTARIEVLRGVDHTFTLEWSQEALVELLLDWLDKLPAGPPMVRR
jgi:pimeloyl-ACP methyl ester carboxylesterase